MSEPKGAYRNLERSDAAGGGLHSGGLASSGPASEERPSGGLLEGRTSSGAAPSGGQGTPSASETFRLRACYAKQGRAVLLSHLEVAHALERVVRRAGLPYAITQGFSPHMKIAFGSALPVGIGGQRELFDVHLVRYVDPDAALDALRRSSVPDLAVESCSYIDRSAPAASNAYPVSVYEARFEGAAPQLFEVPEELTVVRKGAEKVLRVADYLVAGPEVSGEVLRFALQAGSQGSLRPDVFAYALAGEKGRESLRSIVRTLQLPDVYALSALSPALSALSAVEGL